MGNSVATLSARWQPQQPSELVTDLPGVVFKDALGGGRFMKAVRCVHDDGGLVVVKAYLRRGPANGTSVAGEGDEQPEHVVLAAALQRVAEVRRALCEPPLPRSHVWPFDAVQESDRAVYVQRQYLYASLSERVASRPFLQRVEKKWLAFQLLHAVAQSHSRGVVHGDIKCENVLLTSWGWLFLTDFASYKPTTLPVDNPADFSFFFDTGGRRRCYLAPERFVEGAPGAAASAAALEPAADIFSTGCVVAELFLEGQALFDLSQLLAYRREEFDPATTLAQIEDDEWRDLVLHMTARDPAKRLSAVEYLTQWGTRLFPPYFDDLMHGFAATLLTLDPDKRAEATCSTFKALQARILAHEAPFCLQADDADATRPSAVGSEAGVGRADRQDDELRPSASEESEPESTGGVLPSDTASMLLADMGELLGGAGLRGFAAHADRDELGAFVGDDDIGFGADFGLALDETDNAASASPAVALAEMAREEVVEDQVREPGGDFSEVPLQEGGVMPARRKEDVTLPPEGGWQWEGPWELDTTGRGASGWIYWTAAGANKGWSPTCTEHSLWRQRRWVRRRRRSTTVGRPVDAGSGGPGTRMLLMRERSGSEAARLALEKGARCPGMVLPAALLCALLRGCRFPSNKLAVIALMRTCADFCPDDTRLQLIVPYLVAALGEPAAAVRAAALRELTAVLASVETFPLSDAKFFPEYLWPSLSLMPSDPDDVVRATYAECLAPLATASHRFLQKAAYMDQAAKQVTHDSQTLEGSGSQAGSSLLSGGSASATVRYEQELGVLRGAVRQVVMEYLTPDSRGGRPSSTAREALLSGAVELSAFFERHESNDFLLPLLITCLNDREWRLRAAFFSQVAGLGVFVGRAVLEAFLLPCIEQALSDTEEEVAAQALLCLSELISSDAPARADGSKLVIHQRSLVALVERAVPLLCHPAACVRGGAVAFISSAAVALGPVGAHARLLPLVRELLTDDSMPALVLTSQESLLKSLKPPMTRAAFDEAVESAGPSSSSSTSPAPSPQRHESAGASPNKGGLKRGDRRHRTASDGSDDGHNIDVATKLLPYIQAAARMHQRQRQSDPPVTPLQPKTPTAGRPSGLRLPRRPEEGALDLGLSPPPAKLTSPSPGRIKSPSATAVTPAVRGASELHQAMLEAVRGEGMISLPPPITRMVSIAPGGGATETMVPQQALCSIPAPAVAAPSAAPPGQPSSTAEHGGGVKGAVAAAVTTGISPGMGSGTAEWRPRGVLIAHLQEHRRAVNALAVAPSNVFFLSASDDGAVKVWDVRHLEKDVSFRSRLTYSSQGGRILDCCVADDQGQRVASASSEGSVHMWRVEYVTRPNGVPERYTGAAEERRVTPDEGATLAISRLDDNVLLFATQRGGVHAWDVRTKGDAWTVPADPSHGLVENFVADPNGGTWLATATSEGFFSLWDLRFRLCVSEWQHPERVRVAALSPACQPPGQASPLPLLWVATGQVGLWDVSNGTCVHTLRVPYDRAGTGEDSTPAGPHQQHSRLRVEALKQPPKQPPGARALLPLPGGPHGALLSGSTDACVRYWTPGRPEQCALVCGPVDAPPTFELGRTASGVPALLETPTPANGQPAQPRSDAHRDSVLALAKAEAGQRLLFSACRDGAIKAHV